MPTALLALPPQKAVAARRARRLPLATQTTDGQLSSGLREIAQSLGVARAPALACQSCPQTLAAVKFGRCWSIVLQMALRDVPPHGVEPLVNEHLCALDREAMLAWQ